MKMINQSLKSANVYYENGVPFMKLVYTYDSNDGGHEITFPKVEFPFPTRQIPNITQCPQSSVDIETLAYANLFLKDNIYFVDDLVKPKPREMTLEEIEKSLGYPVKIISERKENKND